jgi:hypothetical protein
MIVVFVTRANLCDMVKRLGMLTELDEATMAWLEGHHIRPKDVRAWGAEARIGDVTILTLEVIVSDVDEIGPVPVITFASDLTPEQMEDLKRDWLAKWPARHEPGWVAPELHRTGVPPESRR